MVQTLSIGGGWADSGETILTSTRARVGLSLQLWVKALSNNNDSRTTTIQVFIRFKAPDARRIDWRNRSIYGDSARQMSIVVDGRTFYEDIPDIVVGFGGHVDWVQNFQISHYENGDAGNVTVSVTIPDMMEREQLKIWFPNVGNHYYEHFGKGSRSLTFRVPNITPKAGFVRSGFESNLSYIGFDDSDNSWDKGGASSADIYYGSTRIGALSSSGSSFALTDVNQYRSLFDHDRLRGGNAKLRYSGYGSSRDFNVLIRYPSSYIFTSNATDSHFSGSTMSLPFKGRSFTIRSTISSGERFNRLKSRMGSKFKYDATVSISFGDGSSTTIFTRGKTSVDSSSAGFSGSGSSAYIDFTIDTNNKNAVDNRIKALSKNNRSGHITVRINFYIDNDSLQSNYNSNSSKINWVSNTVDVINVASANANCKLISKDGTIKSLLGNNENYLISGKGTGEVKIPAGMFKSEGSSITSYEVTIGTVKITGRASNNTTSGAFKLNAADNIPVTNAHMRGLPTTYDTNTFTVTAYNDTGGSSSASIPCHILSYSPPTVAYTASWNGSGSGITISKTSSGLRVHPIRVGNANRNGVIKDTNVKIEYEGSGSGTSSTRKTAGNIFKDNVGNGTKVYSDNNGWMSHVNLNDTISISAQNVDPSFSYTITVSAKDIFGTTTTQRITLPAWKPIIHINGRLKSTFFGGYSAEGNAWAVREINDAVVFNTENILGRDYSNIAPYSVRTLNSFDLGYYKAGVFRFENVMGAGVGIPGWNSNWKGIVEHIIMNNAVFSQDMSGTPGVLSSGKVGGDIDSNDSTTSGSGRALVQRITVIDTGKVYSRTMYANRSWTDWHDLTSKGTTVDISGKADKTVTDNHNTRLQYLESRDYNRVLTFSMGGYYLSENRNNDIYLPERFSNQYIYGGPYFSSPYGSTAYDFEIAAFSYPGHNAFIDTGSEIVLTLNLYLWDDTKHGGSVNGSGGNRYVTNKLNRQHLLFMLSSDFEPIGCTSDGIIFIVWGEKPDGGSVKLEIRACIANYGNKRFVTVGLEYTRQCKLNTTISWAYKNNPNYRYKDETVVENLKDVSYYSRS